MVERAERSEKYEEIAGEVLQEHEELRWIGTAGIRIGFMESDRRKTGHGRKVLGERIRVKDLYKCFIPYDFLIVVYDQNVHGMSREQLKILIHHELLHVGMSEDGQEVRYIVNPHDVEDFREILDRYGMDWARH